MSRYKIGDKVILDDQSGVIEAIYLGSEWNLYDVRYGHTFMIAVDVPEEDIQPWQADEQ
jgi:hypothetical protein